jgi:hypothetical protein
LLRTHETPSAADERRLTTPGHVAKVDAFDQQLGGGSNRKNGWPSISNTVLWEFNVRAEQSPL